MGYAQAKLVDAETIPVVDITPLSDGTDPVAVAHALHAASQGLGFIYIKGHGIPDAVIDAARQAAFAFFRADDQQKAAVKVSARHRGWLAAGGAKMQDDAKVDLKESFIWGYQDDTGELPDDHELRGPNQWPGFLPEMEAKAMAYFDHAHRVAHILMRGFALGLDLKEDFFLRSADKPLSRASFVYYPPQTEDAGPDQFGVGPHTDFGVLTVLCQDNVGGLQVEDINGEWIQAPPIPGTLLVNVADLLSRWTDGAYKSTPHRVVNSSGKERYSMAFFLDPNPEADVSCLPSCMGPDRPAKYPPISGGAYLKQRLDATYDFRAEK